jgi:hypothetical protein
MGCILSPFLFFIVIDYIMKKATKDSRTGLQWYLLEQLEDLNFADDVRPISQSRDSLQRKTDTICNIASRWVYKSMPMKQKLGCQTPELKELYI